MKHTERKALRPIALLETLGKAMEKVMATRISCLVEEHQPLPGFHTGGRKTTSPENAIHMVIEAVSAAWESTDNPFVILLMLDVSGAFDNVNHRRLLHNLRRRRMAKVVVKWIHSFISNGTTVIRLAEGDSKKYWIQCGIPQGLPLSPILYLFYIADIADICSAKGHISPLFIDDVNVLIRGPNPQANCQTIESFYDNELSE